MASNGYTISASETNVSIENNTSYVYITGTVTTDGNTYNGYNTAYYNFSASVGNQSYSTGNINYVISTNSTKTFTATLGPFYHNDDGTLGNVSVSSTTLIVPGYSSTLFTRTASVPMSTIPRASSIGDVSGNIGSTVTIPIDRKSSSFTTTLTYAFGSLSGTIVDKTSSTNPTWTIPSSFYTQIPNARYGVGTITCTTYNGNTQVGSSVSRALTAYAVESASKPNVSITNVVETDSVILAKIGSGGAYINGYSKPKVTFSKSANNSASISSVYINGTSVATNLTEYTINNIKTNTITITVYDSRGYSKTATTTLSPFDSYSSPQATISTCKRNTPTDGQVDFEYSGTWYNGTFDAVPTSVTNSLNVELQYKESTSNIWTTYTLSSITPTISGNNISFSDTLGDNNTTTGLFDYTKAYDFKLILSDYLCDGNTGYNKIEITSSITQGIPTFWWDDDFHVEGDLYVKGSNIINFLYPVGSIYMSTTQNSSTASTAGKYGCPIADFVGTWERIQNRFLLSAGSSYTAGATGGSATVALSATNIPSHTHSGTTAGAGGHSHTIPSTYNAYLNGTGGTFTGGSSDPYGTYTSYIDNHTHTFTTDGGSGLSGTAHENMPPYLVVYIWKRTA